jgi:hypothetical protein
MFFIAAERRTEFSRGRQPTETMAKLGQSRVAAAEMHATLRRRYAAWAQSPNFTVG